MHTLVWFAYLPTTNAALFPLYAMLNADKVFDEESMGLWQWLVATAAAAQSLWEGREGGIDIERKSITAIMCNDNVARAANSDFYLDPSFDGVLSRDAKE